MEVRIGMKITFTGEILKVRSISDMDEKGRPLIGGERVVVCDAIEGCEHYKPYTKKDEEASPYLKEGTIGFTLKHVEKFAKECGVKDEIEVVIGEQYEDFIGIIKVHAITDTNEQGDKCEEGNHIVVCERVQYPKDESKREIWEYIAKDYPYTKEDEEVNPALKEGCIGVGYIDFARFFKRVES